MGVGGWLHGVQSKYHVFSETYVPPFLFNPPRFSHRWFQYSCTAIYIYSVSTVRAALEVKQVFEQLAEAEKGGVTPEQKQKLEEQATEKVCLMSYCTLCRLLCFGDDIGADPILSARFLGYPSTIQGWSSRRRILCA